MVNIFCPFNNELLKFGRERMIISLMQKIFFLFVITVTLSYPFKNASAQSEEIRCNTNEYIEKMKQEIPGYAQQLENNDRVIDEWIRNHPNYKTRGVITIPVVVHILYSIANDDSARYHNISDWQVVSEIDAMNEDYSRRNADAYKTPVPFLQYAADCEIQFCLAKRDPNGQPTTGIIHKPTGIACFNDFSSMKYSNSGGDDAWPYTDYLNIWVCCLSGGALGYSTLPNVAMSAEDGCVIHYKAFGRIDTRSKKYNRGRTGTHEVGHWLNLIHLWGDTNCGDDKVNDTPVQKDNNFGCPKFPKTNNCPGHTADGEMFMDYMDYSNDSCMNLFTLGQKQRMLAALENFRPSIKSSGGCNRPSLLPYDIGISEITSPVMSIYKDSIAPEVTLYNYGSNTVTSALIYYADHYGNKYYTYHWNGSISSGESVQVALPAINDSLGYRIFAAYTSSPNGQPDGDTINNFKTGSYYVKYNTTPITDNHFTVYFPRVGDYSVIRLRFDTLSVKDISQFYVSNILGQTIEVPAKKISANTLEANLPIFSTGIYFIRVKMDRAIMTEKIFIAQLKKN